MLTQCSIYLVKLILEKNEINYKSVILGEIELENDSQVSKEEMNKIMAPYGIEVIISREERIVEDAKRCIFELVHELNNADSIIRKSEYLVERLGLSYQQISKIFSKYEPTTLERYSILVKIEKIKEMILEDEFSLSEIAYLMDYSSVQYLSNQFKKETGLSVSVYKKTGPNLRRPLDKLF